MLEELTMAAMLQTSVLAPHLEPRMTSGDRYCRVWMSFVKWCPTQQALPRSAIFTEIVSIEISGGTFSADMGVLELVLLLLLLDFPRSMPPMSLVRMSLTYSEFTCIR